VKAAVAAATTSRDEAQQQLQQRQSQVADATQQLTRANDDLAARKDELNTLQAQQQVAMQALADSQSKATAAQQAQQQSEATAQQAKEAEAEAAKKLADVKTQLDDQTKQLADASQKRSVLKQQSEETQAAANDAAAARDEAQKQLAQAQAQLARAAELEAVSSMRSAFLTEIKKALGTKPGVQVTEDRLVIAGERLFAGGSSALSPAGRDSVNQIATDLKNVAANLAPDTEWLVRVDGHADKQPVPAGGRYPSNWDLSAARAVSVVRALAADGIPANRLVAASFGESQPLDPNNTPAAFAKNRRVEIRLTQR